MDVRQEYSPIPTLCDDAKVAHFPHICKAVRIFSLFFRTNNSFSSKFFLSKSERKFF